MPSFSDTTDVSIIGHSFKTDSRRTPLFHVAQYGDHIIGLPHVDDSLKITTDKRLLKYFNLNVFAAVQTNLGFGN